MGSASSYGERYTVFAILGLASAPDDDGRAGAPAAPEPLSKARKARQARQYPTEPDSQPAAEPGPASPTETAGPPENHGQEPQRADISAQEAHDRRKFAQVCNVLAAACSVIQEGQSLEPGEFRALLAQAQALGACDGVADAASYVMSDVRAIVRDTSGIRLIPS